MGDTMKSQDLKFIKDMHDMLNTLEKYGLHEEADMLLHNNPYVFSYDRNGKWIGPMNNEDGWTA